MPLRLIGLAAVLIVSLLLAPLAAGSQPVGKPARFGGLCLISCEGPGLDAFRGTLRDLDYIEGRTLAFAYRDAGKAERLAPLRTSSCTARWT
jgi:hypothetical protein